MLFNYKAIDREGGVQSGSIEAVTEEVAITSLQRRGFVISSIESAEKKSIFQMTLFERVSSRDLVILSRQISTLFEAQVSALRVFRLLSAEAPTPLLRRSLGQITTDIQGGSNISSALAKHPKVFSPFYINMVQSGEESGKLDQIFLYLADYIDRTYAVTSKARNALIYPAFVVVTFIAVMVLMFTLVIPRISVILIESGQELPFFTKVIIGLSGFMVSYGVFILLLVVAIGFILWRYGRTTEGALYFAELQISVPYIGDLYKKLFLSRIADNISTMLSSGIPMVRSLEITGNVVGNALYEKNITETIAAVKSGKTLSESLDVHPAIPSIMVQMVKVGEETGELSSILETLAKFYKREVENAVDTLINLIEPLMIVGLGLGVGILLSAVLFPIYNLASSI